MDDAGGAAQKLHAATFSVFVNVLLLSAKLIVGVASGSLGMLAEAAHSLLDLLASGFAYTGIRSANRPLEPIRCSTFLHQVLLTRASEAQIGHSTKNIPTGTRSSKTFQASYRPHFLALQAYGSSMRRACDFSQDLLSR